jgi:hypothetical protein
MPNIGIAPERAETTERKALQISSVFKHVNFLAARKTFLSLGDMFFGRIASSRNSRCRSLRISNLKIADY